MKILLAGGGSGGPVQPLLAVALELKKLQPDIEILFVGTKYGPERKMVEEAGFDFESMTAARLRRFFSLRNLFAPVIFIISLFQSRGIINKFHPDVIVSAGGFVAVPLSWMGKLAKVKIVIHQQDATPSLTNKLIAPFANIITKAFKDTSLKNSEWIGNPIRPDIFESKTDVKKYFELHDQLPVLVILGGATGSAQINKLIEEILPGLVTQYQVIHQTGKGKNISYRHQNYHAMELIPFDIYAPILKMAHLVISRAGLGAITDLSALAKPAIIIPLPHSHQEENAKILSEKHAAVVLSTEETTSDNLKQIINSLKFNQKRTEMLSKNISELFPKNAAEQLAKLIL